MDTNGMDTYALVAVGADAVLSVVARHDRMVTAGSAGEKPVIGALWVRRRQVNDGLSGRLRTSVRRAIIALIAHLLPR